MVLKVQIITLFSSFFFGIFLAFLVNINYKYLFHKKRMIKILSTFFLVFDIAILYFLIFKMLNYATFHPYFLIMLGLGFYIGYPISRKLRRK